MNQFDKKDAFAFGWQTFKQNPLFLVGITFLLWAVSGGFSLLNKWLVSSGLELGSFVVILLSIGASILLGMGFIYVALQLYDKQQPVVGDLLKPVRHFWNYVSASILYGLIVFGGLLLLIIPGIIWGIKYSMYRYLIIDKGLGVFDALKESGTITAGSKWNLFWFFILLGLFNILGALLLVIGLLVTIPISVLALIYAYRKLGGNNIVENIETPSIGSTTETIAEEPKEENQQSV